MRLSIAMPVYNFAEFIPDALHSILDQRHGRDIEVVVTDGASTDETPALMERLCARYANLTYNRLPEKGGIDKDMALAVAATHGDYVWLFSGDDIMHDGALDFILGKLSSEDDVYLCRHVECTGYMEPLYDYPVLEPDVPDVFDLSDPDRRKIYFNRVQNSEAFFSFCSGLVIRRETWDRVPFDPSWDGTCWAHAARLFAALEGGLKVNYLGRLLVSRRGDNDSFLKNGIVDRFRIQVEGFHDIINTTFGNRSHEAREMRRAIRNEFSSSMALVLKLLQHTYPDRESKVTLDRIVARAYSDRTWLCFRTRLAYWLMPYWKLRHEYEGWCKEYFDPEGHREEQARLKAEYVARKQAEAAGGASLDLSEPSPQR